MEEYNNLPLSPAPSGDDDASVSSFTTQILQQRTKHPAAKLSNAVRPENKIPVAGEDCKVRLNARSIFGYGKNSAGDENKQSHTGAECRRDQTFQPDTLNHTKKSHGTPTRPNAYCGIREEPLISDDCGKAKISCKLFESGAPKGQKKAVDPEIQFIGQQKAVQKGTSVKISSDCKNADDDDDVCIVGWTWNTQAKRKLNADHVRTEAEQNRPEHRSAVAGRDGDRQDQNVKDLHSGVLASKSSAPMQKSTSFIQSSVNPTALHPLKLSSHNHVTSITNNQAHAKQTNPIKTSTTANSIPFNSVTSNSSMAKSLPNNPVNTNVFAPKSNVQNSVTMGFVGAKSSVSPSQGKTIPSSFVLHQHPAANSYASTTHPRSANPQCTKSGDSVSVVSIIPEEPEAAASDRAYEELEHPVNEKQRRGRTKKPILVEPNFEVVKRKRGRPRKEQVAIDEPARKRPATEADYGKVSAPLNTAVSGLVSAETVSSREKSAVLPEAPRTSFPNAITTSSNDVTKSVGRTGPVSADQVARSGGQSEKEKSWVFEADDEPVLKQESDLSLSDSEVDFSGFSSGIDFRSSLTSTPIKECSVEAEDTKPPKKSKLRIRFKPFVEQFSYDDDADVVLSADALANVNRHTSMKAKKVRLVDQLLAQKEREVDSRQESVGQSAAVPQSLDHPNERSATRETAAGASDTRSTHSARTESVAAAGGGTVSSMRPEAHGVKMSLKPLKDSSDIVSGPISSSNTARQLARPLPAGGKFLPIASARQPTPARTHEAAVNCIAGKAVETCETAKIAGQLEAVSASTGPRRSCAGEVSNSIVPPLTDALPDFAKSQVRLNENRTKSSVSQTSKSIENSAHRKPEDKLTSQPAQSHQRQAPAAANQKSTVEITQTQQCRTMARPKAHLNVPQSNQILVVSPRDPAGPLQVPAKVARDESRLRPRAQKELSFGRKRKMEDLKADDGEKENQPKRTKTLVKEIAPTGNSVADSGKVAPQKNEPASGVVVPNSEHVAALLDLQQKLMSVSDMSVLRQVVQVIEETGKYKLNEATFDFDLCNLDPLTVKKLQHCLSARS